jgi:hypothetical protein
MRGGGSGTVYIRREAPPPPTRSEHDDSASCSTSLAHRKGMGGVRTTLPVITLSVITYQRWPYR